ncbi:MAG: hypothetical protein GY722_21440, partial [bacterium]|nr:hypothetical protein [bacterium]
FAKTDVVGFDPDGCLVTHSQKIRFGADGDKPFETIYLYTTGHIEGNLIPQLIELAELAPEDSVYFAGQAGNWQNLLTLNDDLRTEALENVVENRSFSAGAEFGYTHESTESETFAWEIGVYSEMESSTEIGFKIAGTGASAKLTSTLRFEANFGGSVEEETILTTGYSLSDDDPGDYFSIDVATDPVYGTPVFDTRSGRSSCPWEADTQPRDGVIISTTASPQSDVPPDGVAEFPLTIVNDSQSEEAREYQIRAIQTTNPGGAILRINGSLLDQGLSYFIEPGSLGTQEAVLTVERGPTNFTYENLRIMAVAPCEYELWEAGGTLAVSDTLEIDVYFSSPCTDISLLDPGPGWVFNETMSA